MGDKMRRRLAVLKEVYQCPVECPYCKGSGKVPVRSGTVEYPDVCCTCNGYGRVLKITTVEYKELDSEK